ncbi:MAG: sulfur oxidation c-type cytochrome SoxX [Gammaproteobacteria bacterium RIFOXYA12_FULL_61_12]|nr:MAG: sulfur oxidation c-type cytochrome SoxX [Gammaproteobacteria bacterium RIFOXYD12_FULL_61_37]OGT91328.1 MAG: sulfur oxidation c-type cytochrome SoxX [Gammaproteobacteria bacterium RIFOXYA12_FULL_61_12]
MTNIKTNALRWGLKGAVLFTLILPLGAPGPAQAAEAGATTPPPGKEIAFDRKLGNCLACHAIEGGDSPGDLGPPLAAMQQRFPDRAKLRAQIADPRKFNADTRMPPFGAYKILSDQEIDLVVDFIHKL